MYINFIDYDTRKGKRAKKKELKKRLFSSEIFQILFDCNII